MPIILNTGSQARRDGSQARRGGSLAGRCGRQKNRPIGMAGLRRLRDIRVRILGMGKS